MRWTFQEMEHNSILLSIPKQSEHLEKHSTKWYSGTFLQYKVRSSVCFKFRNLNKKMNEESFILLFCTWTSIWNTINISRKSSTRMTQNYHGTKYIVAFRKPFSNFFFAFQLRRWFCAIHNWIEFHLKHRSLNTPKLFSRESIKVLPFKFVIHSSPNSGSQMELLYNEWIKYRHSKLIRSSMRMNRGKFLGQWTFFEAITWNSSEKFSSNFPSQWTLYGCFWQGPFPSIYRLIIWIRRKSLAGNLLTRREIHSRSWGQLRQKSTSST